MSDLLSSTLGAVGQVGEAIDKYTGGRALRGALGGKPRELASVIPFSDSLGITDAKDATSGRDLTDAYGLTGKHDKGWGASTAGFLADNILSPANIVGGIGAFKAAPTLAKGVSAGAKALTGLDAVESVGRGINSVAGKFGKLPMPKVPKYGGSADLADAYSSLSRGFPDRPPTSPYHVPDEVLSSHGGAMPEASLLDAERRNNQRIHEYMGVDRRNAGIFEEPTTIPGQAGTGGWNEGGVRFDAPHQGLAPASLSESSVPSSMGDLEAQLAAMGWGNPEPTSGLGSFKKFFNNESGSLKFPDPFALPDALPSHDGPWTDPTKYIDKFGYDAYESGMVSQFGDKWKDYEALALEQAPSWAAHKASVFDDLAGSPSPTAKHATTEMPSLSLPSHGGPWSDPIEYAQKFGPDTYKSEMVKQFGDDWKAYDKVAHVEANKKLAAKAALTGVDPPDIGSDLLQASPPGAYVQTPQDLADRSMLEMRERLYYPDILPPGMARRIDAYQFPGTHPSVPSPPTSGAVHARRPFGGIASASDPQRRIDGIVGTSVKKAAQQFGEDTSLGAGGMLTPEQGEKFAASFIRPPSFPATKEGVDLASEFANTMSEGMRGAEKYFGPLYHDINSRLRMMGPEGAAADVAALRSAPVGSIAQKAADEIASGAADKLRYNSQDEMEDILRTTRGLTNMMEYTGLPEAMDLYRGVDGPGKRAMEQMIGAELRSPDAIGKEITDPGFMSTSWRKKTANEFASYGDGYNRAEPGVVFRFHNVPQGKPAALMNAAENEILFPPGRRIKITGNSAYPTIDADLYSKIMAMIAGGGGAYAASRQGQQYQPQGT